MRVLLLGEFSGVFTELRKGLLERGVEVVSINDGDGWKNYPADLRVDNMPLKQIPIILKPFRYVYKLILYRLGLNGLIRLYKLWPKLKLLLSEYDVVQLSNPVVLPPLGSVANLIVLRYVFNHNKKVCMNCMGGDYYELKYRIKHMSNHSLCRKHRIANLFGFPYLSFKYFYCLFYKKLNDYAVANVKAIIPITKDYKDVYNWTGKMTGIIPIAVSESVVGEPIHLQDGEKIIIFHGWQLGRESDKGNDIFDNVIHKIVLKYGQRVDYQVVHNIPYNDYITKLRGCHLFVDQLYSDDKGVNGLLGMAAGKVVFSGFKKESLENYAHYDGKQVGISSYNDEEYLYNRFSELIDNPRLIEQISQNAIEFVKKNQITPVVTEMYLDVWRNI